MTNNNNEMNAKYTDTKDVIWKAYKKVREALEGKAGSVSNPKADLEAKRQNGVVAKVDKLDSVEGIEIAIGSLKRSIGSSLDAISTDLVTNVKEFQDVQEAIKVQKGKLKELFDIEEEAYALIALVNTKEQLAAEYDATMEAKKKELETVLSELKDKISQTREDMSKAIKETQAQADLENKRKQEEWEYEFARTTKQKEDELQDRLNESQKTFNQSVDTTRGQLAEERAELQKTAKELEAKQEYVTGLEKKVAHLEETTEVKVAEAVHNATTQLTNEFNREKEFLVKGAKQEQSILESKVEGLEAQLADSKENVASLTAKLEKAYSEIREMAKTVAENAGDSKVNDSLKAVISEMNKKSN